MTKFINNKKSDSKRGSILVFTIIILGIMMATAISLITVATIARKTSIATGKSVASFQSADTGIEMVLASMYDPKNTKASDILSSSCNDDGKIVDSANGFTVTLFNGETPPREISCDSETRIGQIRRIKSVSNDPQAKRAVQVDIPGDVTNGLISRWNFDSYTSGNIAEDTELANDGTIINNAPISNDTYRGNKVIEFNGTTQYVSVDDRLTDLSFSGGGNGSISWWQYPYFDYNDNEKYGFWDSHDNTSGEISCQKFTDKKIYCGWNNYGSNDDDRVVLFANNENMPKNKWSHYILTWEDNGYTKLYHNGSQIGPTRNNTSINNFNSHFEIARQAGGVYFDGKMDDIRVYNRALTSREVKRIFNNTK